MRRCILHMCSCALIPSELRWCFFAFLVLILVYNWISSTIIVLQWIQNVLFLVRLLLPYGKCLNNKFTTIIYNVTQSTMINSIWSTRFLCVCAMHTRHDYYHSFALLHLIPHLRSELVSTFSAVVASASPINFTKRKAPYVRVYV